MATIIEQLQSCVAALTAAVIEVANSRTELATYFAAKKNEVVTIINNFNQRPAVRSVFVDPIDGNDANDGAAVDRPRKSLDTVLADLGTDAVAIYLMNDATIRRRHTVNGNLTIFGVQKAANAAGFINQRRQITFLGTAENSPNAEGLTFGSGMFLNGPALVTGGIDFLLPDQTAGQTYPAHLYSDYGASYTILNSTLRIGSSLAKSLIGSRTLPVDAFLSMALGTGASGHVFEGVAAGANPNALYAYRTNVTAG